MDKGGIALESEKPSSQCSKCSHTNTVARSEKAKKDMINRLNRIEGQVRGIKGMIEKDVYCDDVLNQITSVHSAMNSLSRLILNNHMKSCLVTRIQAGEMEVVDELLYTIEKMLK
ncbi:MAG TPA: metal-sensitive transcriptional regulator [Clostridia bacterium]|nr:metal-sensitive transcriptional regulator [Clostridia bacterium]